MQYNGGVPNMEWFHPIAIKIYATTKSIGGALIGSPHGGNTRAHFNSELNHEARLGTCSTKLGAYGEFLTKSEWDLPNGGALVEHSPETPYYNHI